MNGKQLKEVRSLIGWNQERLSAELPCSRESLSKYENNVHPLPPEIKEMILDVLDYKGIPYKEQEPTP
ncbi:helix-turn-helix transcriptional regulator (plasmid) [Pontibacillus sp. ALD_SL1]|uniref:helix-turn-helix domain-containing protein n=1 Tax=Pontibacillus sp. ALD_SL1 TaxID=2777185 RepID=UPI001A9593A7|nr:helix-turn-helix transcriptional regulator [Pontibacillus sp. ALD_SL1]QST02190.1 helix-turn-helix transcriptional regulator [Pontibacillus sp. ALD_SL1]